jgi:hypothetical protein
VSAQQHVTLNGLMIQTAIAIRIHGTADRSILRSHTNTEELHNGYQLNAFVTSFSSIILL